MKPKVNLIKYYLSLTLILNTSFVLAGAPPSNCNNDISGNLIPSCESSNNENRLYAGLVFNFDSNNGFIPDFVVGARSLHIDSSNDIAGADLSARISYSKHNKSFIFDSTRLVYVGGERDVMGNIGIGYSNTDSSLLGTIAIQAPYSRIGTDYEFGKNKFKPYLEINSLDKPNKPQETCPSGSLLFDGECVYPPG